MITWRMVRMETSMNTNQAKGTAKDIAGKVQEEVGKATGSATQQVKGLAKQGEGKLQKGIGKVQESAKDIADDADRELKK